MKNGLKVSSFFIILLALVVFPLSAQRGRGPIIINLASLVPENTPWGTELKKMSAEWARITNGEVLLQVFHGGIRGDEAEVLRKLRVNEIQAAMFTSSGLNTLVDETMTLSYPLLIRNNKELDVVMEKIRPELNAKFQQTGFVTLALARAGWVRLFSKEPIITPADARKYRMGTTPDDEKMLQAFKTLGFKMFPISNNDLMVSLRSQGGIEAFYYSPIAAAGSQLFGVAKNMSSLNLAPLMGGIIINNAAWNRIPAQYRPQLQAAFRRLETQIESSIVTLETDAINVMEKYGLKINRLTEAQEQAWYDDLARYEKDLVGPVFKQDLYRRITTILAEYRKGQ